MTRWMTALATMSWLVSLAGQSLEADLQRAIQRELATGDCRVAIEEYQTIATRARQNRHVASRALLRMAGCLERMGSVEARGTYERIVQAYGETEAATSARARLASVTPEGPFKIRVLDEAISQSGWRAFSPDGRFVVLKRQKGLPGQVESWLVKRDLTTGSEVILASGIKGTIGIFEIAPDGRWLAARVERGGPKDLDSANDVLLVATLSGDQVHQIEGARRSGPLTWSPDGRFIPYLGVTDVAAMFEIRMFDVRTQATIATGLKTSPGPGRRMQWHPDANQLALLVSANGADDSIAIYELTTRTSRTLTVPSGGRVLFDGWAGDSIFVGFQDRAAPDSRLVLRFSTGTEGWQKVCTATSLTPRQQAPAVFTGDQNDRCLGATVDGTHYVTWTSETKQLHVIDLKTGTSRRLTVGAAEEHFAHLADDGRVAFVTNRDGFWGLYLTAVQASPPATPVLVRRFDRLPNTFTVDAWTADAIFTTVVLRDADIWRAPLDPASARINGPALRLTQDGPWNLAPRVSPDGRRIAYRAQQGAEVGIAVMDADGLRERVLTTSLNAPGWMPPIWRSPDELLFTTGYRWPQSRRRPLLPDDGTFVVWSVDATTGASRQLATITGSNDVGGARGNWDYSRARDAVIYVSGGEGSGPHEFRARSLKDGTDTRLAILEDSAHVYDFSIAPDGRRLAYSISPGPSAPNEFGVLTLESGARTVLAETLADITEWSKDGRFVSYAQFFAGQPGARVMDVENRRSWALAEDLGRTGGPGAVAAFGEPGDGSWSPDGRFVVIGNGSSRMERLQVQGVTLTAMSQGSVKRH